MKRIKSSLLVLVVICLLLSPVYSQKTKIKVDGNIIKSYIEFLAKDEHLGRKPLTPEFGVCLDWAAGKFKEWGLKPAGDNGTYFQAVPIEGRRANFAWSLGVPELKVNGREFYIRYGDFSIDARSPAGKTIGGDIVFAGYGISAPGKGLDEYKDINVRGKYVLVFKGSPWNAPSGRSRFLPQVETKEGEDPWVEESKDDNKIKTAYNKGAAGIIMYNPDPAADDPFARFMRREQREERFEPERDFMIITEIGENVFKWIMWQDPQVTSRGFSASIDNLRRDIKKKTVRSFETGMKADIKGYDSIKMYGPEYNNNVCKNIIAKIEGTDRKLKNEYVIMGGHFDHLGITNGAVYNGADDNASGSAVVMEVARLLVKNKFKPKRTIIFCLWTAEEMGLIGSTYYVGHPCDGVTMDKVVTYFNMDMVGLGENIGAPGALNFPEINEVILKHQDPDIVEALEMSTGGPGGSDHSAFIRLGIQALALMTSGGGGHPDYHDTGDDTEKIEPEILRKTAKYVLQGTINLANETKVKLLIPDRQERYDVVNMNIICLNPELGESGGRMSRRGGMGSWNVVEAADKIELVNLIKERIDQMRGGSGQADPMARFRRRFGPRSSFNTGINAKAVDSDIDIIKIAQPILNFGRVDIKGDDGIWLNNGLTEKGKMAVKELQDSNIVINLVNPTSASFEDMLTFAEKPFIVVNTPKLNSTSIELMNKKNVIVAVNFDPEKVDDCVNTLDKMKNDFGDTDNLILYLLSKKNLNEKKSELYKKLRKKGWTKEEIFAIAGTGTDRFSQGNLQKLGGPRPMMGPRR